MAQITTGLRRALNHPRMYAACQILVGARRSWRRLVEEDIRPTPGMRILDIGCGPAELLDYLPRDITYYWGFDLSPAYIAAARERYQDRGRFEARRVSEIAPDDLPPFDTVLALGLLHHLDDPEALGVFRLARAALVPTGRLITVDPCFADGQSALSRFLVRRDRGQSVRTERGYRELAAQEFARVRVRVEHDRIRIPYTHITMECAGVKDAVETVETPPLSSCSVP